MSKLLSPEILTETAPQRLTMVWQIDATSGRPKSNWVAEPRLPSMLCPPSETVVLSHQQLLRCGLPLEHRQGLPSAHRS